MNLLNLTTNPSARERSRYEWVEGCCTSCGETLELHTNIITEHARTKVELSQMCEYCFDSRFTKLQDKLDLLDSNIIDLCKNDIVLAGGALRKLVDPKDEVMDYDLFRIGERSFYEGEKTLLKLGYSRTFSCPTGKLESYKNKDGIKVQLISLRKYDSIQDIVDSFDITACCCGYTDGSFYQTREFVTDVLNKRIGINKVEYPKATLNRIIKYANKGYKLTRTGNSKFIELVNAMAINELNGQFYID